MHRAFFVQFFGQGSATDKKKDKNVCSFFIPLKRPASATGWKQNWILRIIFIDAVFTLTGRRINFGHLHYNKI